MLKYIYVDSVSLQKTRQHILTQLVFEPDHDPGENTRWVRKLFEFIQPLHSDYKPTFADEVLKHRS